MTAAANLLSLAQAAFTAPALNPFEETLVRECTVGAEARPAGASADPADPGNNPAKSDGWDKDREIRADLIRWLCVNRQARKLVDPKGIQACGAKVSGALDLSYVTVPFPLALRRCRLTAETKLQDVEIAELDFEGSWLESFTCDRAKVKGDVFLRYGFHAAGEVRLLGAEIGGDLDCSGGSFENQPPTGVTGSADALSADGAVVKGSVFLRNGFTAKGEVRLLDAQIGGVLDCSGASFQGKVNAQAAVIKGGLVWASLQDPAATSLALTNATSRALIDDAGSWPAAGNLILDGFAYEHIYRGPKDAKTRLDWLARQGEFKPQPYRQLAKVLKDEGDSAGARAVLFNMEKLRRRQGDPRWYVRLWGFVLRWTIGYGYYPAWSLISLLILILFGWGFFHAAYVAGNMVPTDKDAYWDFEFGQKPPAHYQDFHAFVYSLENSLPLVKLGQADRWQPEPSPQGQRRIAENCIGRILAPIASPVFLRGFLWIQILFGWILATFFAAGVTGILHKE